MGYELELKSAHLIVPAEIATEIFGTEPTVYASFKEENNSLLVSPKSNSWFSKLHKSSEIILKTKDMVGTKSISIGELLIDHELDQSNRKLSCEINAKKNFLKINF